jgi:hypothetical protein
VVFTTTEELDEEGDGGTMTLGGGELLVATTGEATTGAVVLGTTTAGVVMGLTGAGATVAGSAGVTTGLDDAAENIR